MRTHRLTESVDLIYLDPPFNSQATYNVLFRGLTGEQSASPDRGFRGYVAFVGRRRRASL